MLRRVLAHIFWLLVARPLLFWWSAETAHHWTMATFASLLKLPGCRRLFAAFFRVDDSRLTVRKFGLVFKNPVGLAAGMDKNARSYNDFAALGFGFVEVGTVTAREQAGNPKPRLFRLEEDVAIVNRLGMPNDGVKKVADRMAACKPQTILGINIGKSTATPNEAAQDDYLISFEHLYPLAAYFVVNVSSPNTPGLRKLQAVESLGPLLRSLIDRNRTLASERNQPPKPLLVKIAPDLDEEQRNEIVDLCQELRLAGIVVANTTVSRQGLKTAEAELARIGDGGLSGQPLTRRCRELVAAIYQRTRGGLPIIGVGGIMTPDDALQMILAGASLIQVYTGLIYWGPSLVAEINRYLAEQLRQRGATSVEELVGQGSGRCATETAETLPV